MRIAITGPAASGKGTISRMVAAKLHCMHFDAGLVFRYCAYKNTGADTGGSTHSVANSLGKEWDYIWMSNAGAIVEKGLDITHMLHNAEVTLQTAKLASDPSEFFAMLAVCEIIMRRYSSVVVDGRSAGTYLLSDADHIFYLDASLSVRAKRRHEDFLRKGSEQTLAEVTRELAARDLLDKNREIDPLRVPDKARLIDTGKREAADICNLILSLL